MTPYEIQGCHRLRSTNKVGVKNTIIRFTNRRFCEDIMLNKSKIKDLKMDNLGESVKSIYINDNLCSYYKDLGAKCRRLKKKRKISETWYTNVIVRIKLKDNSIKVITHQHDLDAFFPNFVYFE